MPEIEINIIFWVLSSYQVDDLNDEAVAIPRTLAAKVHANVSITRVAVLTVGDTAVETIVVGVSISKQSLPRK